MTNDNVALLFPGQGSQDVGMGRDLAERDSEIMELWKKAERISRIPLRGIYWEGGENMDDTSRLQPALTIANISLWAELSKYLKPGAAAGHSLGEYSALVAASVLDLDTTLELVTLRGKLMAEADPDGHGAMAAIVKMDLDQAQALVDDVKKESAAELLIANYNTPAQFVASGSKGAISLLIEKARERKGRAIQLAVSGAFHSPLMAEAAAEMNKALEKCSFSNARIPVYSNVTGKAVRDAGEIKKLLMQQMTSSVQWIDTVRNMFTNGLNTFVECGPKNVLAKMVAPILSPVTAEDTYTTSTFSGVEDIAGFRK